MGGGEVLAEGVIAERVPAFLSRRLAEPVTGVAPADLAARLGLAEVGSRLHDCGPMPSRPVSRTKNGRPMIERARPRRRAGTFGEASCPETRWPVPAAFCLRSGRFCAGAWSESDLARERLKWEPCAGHHRVVEDFKNAAEHAEHAEHADSPAGNQLSSATAHRAKGFR